MLVKQKGFVFNNSLKMYESLCGIVFLAEKKKFNIHLFF